MRPHIECFQPIGGKLRDIGLDYMAAIAQDFAKIPDRSDQIAGGERSIERAQQMTFFLVQFSHRHSPRDAFLGRPAI
jgi:hypothetical protein